MKLDINEEDFRCLLICAFRYALGRKTYVVEDMCTIIDEYKNHMPTQLLHKIISEINEAIKRKEAGMDCDIQDWRCLCDSIGAYLLEKAVE